MTREEIIENSGIINSGDLTIKLEELESCGCIRKYFAYGMKKKNAIYQLMDSYTLFYFSFLEDYPTDDEETNLIYSSKDILFTFLPTFIT